MNTLTEDQQEIRQLLARYCHAIDGHDDEGWAGLFTEDGSFDIGGEPLVGHEALRKCAAAVPPGLRHVVANEVIEVEGDVAHARCYLLLFSGSPRAVGMT